MRLNEFAPDDDNLYKIARIIQGNTQGRLEGVNEEVNPETFNRKFKHEVKIGNYLYKADLFNMEYGFGQALRIRCFDGNKQIGRVLFKNYGDHIESEDTEVHPNYKGQGIATNMYAYAKMLGNDIFPSFIRTKQGKDMWNSWIRSKQAKHITPPGRRAKIAR